MPDSTHDVPPLVHLHYDKGELVMKEGDFGISIYKILSGQVSVFKRVGQKEVPLATLGRGEVFGEMIFLNRLLEARSASVRALQDVEVEVWHPSRLSMEYGQMPPILKYIINQTLSRLNRMNKVVSRLSTQKKEEKDQPAKLEPGASQRKYYRKEFESPCYYRPLGAASKVRLQGRIRDLSLGGVGVEVSARNARSFPHEPGEEFFISTTLPNGQDLEMAARVRSSTTDQAAGQLLLGLEFTDLTADATKRLGFFLMS